MNKNFIVIGAAGAFLGGQLTSYVFHRPRLNDVAGIVTLIAGGVAGITLSRAALATGIAALKKFEDRHLSNGAKIALLCTTLITSVLIYAAGARALINRCTPLSISYKEACSFFVVPFATGTVFFFAARNYKSNP